MRIKICGITNEDDARQAALLGADAIGLNFYPQSPRFIPKEKAQAILSCLPPFVEPVGLFVHEPWDRIEKTLARLPRIRTVQWHGDHYEPVPQGWPYRFIPAFRVGEDAALKAIELYLDRCRIHGRLPDAILVDGHAPDLYGGSGHTAPWQLLANFQSELPLILAGGLTPDNVAQAVRIVRPYAIDVASGVEASPGKKDPEKMRLLIDRARETARLP